MKMSQDHHIILRDLFSSCDDVIIPQQAASLQITGITQDSRKVKAGFLFVALQGNAQNGERFISSAINSGAVAVVGGSELNTHYSVPVITAANPRLTLSRIAARFYARQPEHNVAVTGTNGKTSIVHFCQQIWHNMGINSACVGTTGIIDYEGKFDYERDNFLTTPDSVKLHDILARLADKGVTHLAMEASSHGLDQHRLDGVKIEAAAFTNITRDHLDYHGSFECYFKAKSRLFSRLLPEGKTAILNADSDVYAALREICHTHQQKVITYGFNGSEIQLISITPRTHGSDVIWCINGTQYQTHLGLIGEFQVYNIAAAIGLVLASGGDERALMAVIDKTKPVVGRMQSVANSGVYIDYAHTPDALKNALTVLRPHTNGKLWVVFGCGGNRDQGKRVLMGEVAHQCADHAIITDDNPRDEDPDAIRAAIIAACPSAHNIGDRKDAIAYAITHKQPGDVVLIAGKGHEQLQIIGSESIAFSDLAVAQTELARL